MKEFMTLYLSSRVGLVALAVFACMQPALAQQQPFCASDGQAAPQQLLERFINADCPDCWRDPMALDGKPGQAVLDWVVPSVNGDDAALSAVASVESLRRLQALRLALPLKTDHRLRDVKPLAGATLRVAHGLALGGYLGASIELKQLSQADRQQTFSAWLALVEALPVGSEGSPVARHLVRNVLELTWDGMRAKPASNSANEEAQRRFESRVMSVAQGVDVERLLVIGWIENAAGEVVLAAQSSCESLVTPTAPTVPTVPTKPAASASASASASAASSN